MVSNNFLIFPMIFPALVISPGGDFGTAERAVGEEEGIDLDPFADPPFTERALLLALLLGGESSTP